MGRRPRGGGGVSKVEKRGRVYWQATFRRGEERWTGPLRSARDDAELDRIAYVRDHGDSTLLPEETVAEFFTRWLKLKESKARATYSNYEREVRMRIVPAFGGMKLSALRVRHINALLMQGQRERSAGSVRLTKVTLTAGLKQALREGLVERNEAELAMDITVPRQAYVVFTRDEARAFLRACEGHKYEALFVALLSCGLRVGEACGLQWEHINVVSGEVYVEGQYKRIAGHWQRTPLKNNRVRWIVLPEPARSALQLHRHRTIVASEYMERQNHYNLVFPSVRGEPLANNTVNQSLARILKRAGLPHMTAHGLRHSCASLLAAQGVPDVMIAGLLGHASPDITRKIYLHADIEARKQVAERMHRVLSTDIVHTDAADSLPSKAN